MCRKPETNQHKKVLLPQDPTVCQTPPTTTKQPLMKRSPHPLKVAVLISDRPVPTGTYFIDIPPLSSTPRNFRSRNALFSSHPQQFSMRKTPRCLVLLRKEVIQPHLPVRLPCYDLVPIASPTFDSSLPTRGLGHRLRVLPTFVT